jgi:hypothetical protein
LEFKSEVFSKDDASYRNDQVAILPIINTTEDELSDNLGLWESRNHWYDNR